MTMMPFLMIAYVSLGPGFGEPKMITMEFAKLEACMTSGKTLVRYLDAAGFCIDRMTGATVVWAPGEDQLEKDEDAPPPPIPQRKPAPPRPPDKVDSRTHAVR